MLDPGTESIITSLASPTILAIVFGFILQKYLRGQEETLKGISDTITLIQENIQAMQVRIAVAENRHILVEETRRELQILRDGHTMTRASVDRVWNVLDNKRAG